MTAVQPSRPTAPVVARPFGRRDDVLLLAITLLGAALRLLDLGQWSVWVDEAHTWRDATMPLEEFWARTTGWYPTSFLMLRWLMDHGVLPQFSEGWLRLPFAFFGIVAVPLLALLGRRIVGPGAALFAALLLAINPWHIYWSQNARAYVLVVFFTVLATGLHFRAVEARSKGFATAAVASVLVCGSCHSTGLLLLPVFFVHWCIELLHLRGRRLWIAVAIVTVAVMAAPHVVRLLPPLRDFLASKRDPSPLHLLQTSAFYFRLPLLAAAALGAWLLHRDGRPARASKWLLLASAAVPMLLLAFLGATMMKVTARYAVCVLPAVLLLAGVAAVRAGQVLRRHVDLRRWPRLLPAAVLPAILCLDSATYDLLYYTVQFGDRGRWREVKDHVLRAAGDRPVIVVTSNEPSMVYYLRPNHYRSVAEMTADNGALVIGIETQWVFGNGSTEQRGWNGFSYLNSIRMRAQGDGAELFVAVMLPELDEKDLDGSLRRAIREMFDLVLVLPCQTGPKDSTIYLWRVRAPH